MAVIAISSAYPSTQPFGAALSGERDRLVRLCARMSGDPQIAEDLAQETLFEAWRSQGRLRDPAEIAPWLTAIARNVCLRWQRAQGRERLYVAPSASAGDVESNDPLERIAASDGDLTLQLERDELAGLLGRALALLPAEAREALVAAYLDELPQQEIAARLGLREGALRARLHRGRQMLRRVLEDDLRRDALTWGLLTESEPQWQETRIWCPFCGVHHLACRFDRATGSFAFRCAGVCQPGIEGVVGSGERTDALATLTSPKALLSRQCLTLGVAYRSMMNGAREICPACGLPARIAQWQPGDTMPAPISVYGILIDCPHCGLIDGATPWHLALDTAAAIQFWRRHPRMRALPIETLDFAGRPAVQTGFESSAEHARLAIITARDTLEVLHTAESG